MKSKIAHKIKHRVNAKDKFYTPLDLAKELIEIFPFGEGDLVLDPCYGKGVFYENYPSYVRKEFCEIDLDIDFFKFNSKVDWCVSNPPYSLLDKWLKKTCEISNKGFGYLVGLHNITAKRMELCNKYGFGLTKLHLFKVYKWFGMSCFSIFEKDKDNIISYNRSVWREDKTIKIKQNDEKNYRTIDSFLEKKG